MWLCLWFHERYGTVQTDEILWNWPLQIPLTWFCQLTSSSQSGSCPDMSIAHFLYSSAGECHHENHHAGKKSRKNGPRDTPLAHRHRHCSLSCFVTLTFLFFSALIYGRWKRCGHVEWEQSTPGNVTDIWRFSWGEIFSAKKLNICCGRG